MRVLVVTPTFLPVVGGAEMGVHEIYSRLGRAHDVRIVTPSVPRSILDEYRGTVAPDPPYAVTTYPNPWARYGVLPRKAASLAGFALLAALRGQRRWRPDAVNLHFVSPQGLPLLQYCRVALPGARLVCSLVGRRDVYAGLNPFARWYMRRVLRGAQAIVPNSPFYLESSPWTDDRRVQVVPYGVETRRYAPDACSTSQVRARYGIAATAPVLLCVQRLHAVKRVDVVIRALAAVRRHDRAATLLVVGRGPERAALEELARSLHVENDVIFAGYVDEEELPGYFAAADVFAFGSTSETFGVVFAQAMAAGLPIVATRSSCIPGVVGHGENGVLVPPGDPEAMAEAVLHLLHEPAVRGRMARQNVEHATANLDWEIISARYEEILAGAGSGAPGRTAS